MFPGNYSVSACISSIWKTEKINFWILLCHGFLLTIKIKYFFLVWPPFLNAILIFRLQSKLVIIQSFIVMIASIFEMPIRVK